MSSKTESGQPAGSRFRARPQRFASPAADGRSAFAVALSWDTVYDAAQWEEAVTTYVNEAFEPDIPGFPPTTPCGVDTCWNVAGRMIAFARRGTSSALVFGPTIPAAEVVADAVVGQGSTSG